MREGFLTKSGAAALALIVSIGATPAPPPTRETQRQQPDLSEVRLSIGEAALMDYLKAATPYTVNIPLKVFALDLTFSEPSGLQLKDGKATFSVRARGSGVTLPLDQVISPVFTVVYDRGLDKYYAVVSSLPIDIVGIGRVDLKDYLARVEIPAVLQDLWRFSDRPVGLNLNIRRVAILDHVLEVGANISFTPMGPGGQRAAGPRGQHGR